MKLVMLLLSPFMFICGFFSLYSLIRRERIDLVNAHWILPNGFIASFASLLLGTPLVSTLPGSDVYMADRNRFYRFMARFATKHSIHVTSNSPQLISDLIDINTHEAKIKEELLLKTSPIIYGVDPKKFFPTTKWKRRISKQFNIPLTDRVIVAVGRLVAKKGFRYLIEAAPAILKKYPSTKFVVIGEGDARSDLEERVQHLGIKDSFRFPGWVDYAALIHYYNYSDIFILPSIRDQDGNLDDQSVSVIEAMSCGKPIVTTDFPGYKLVVRDGVNGYLVPEKNSRAISKSIIALLKSPILRRKMGQASRKLVQTNFSWPKIGEQYTKLFSQYVNLEYSSDIPQILNEKSRLKKAEQIESFLQIVEIVSKQKRCLDVGSSSGIITAKLARHFKTVLGVDFDPVAIEKAKKKFSKIKNLSFKVMDATDLALSDSSFDVVICNQVYCDVSDPKKLMQEIYRVLKPGGVCFFGARNKYVLVVDHNFTVRESKAFAFFTSREKYCGHTRCQAHTDGADIGFDMLHGVVDSQTSSDRATWGVDIQFNIFFWTLVFEEEKLSNNNVGNIVINFTAKENNSILKQARIDIVGAFT
jgi:glycosyltransferase involved in cell wall biosynthesis/SAM-dependent methyltransferase